MKDIQTKKVKVINKETLIVTIDISKVTNVGYCRCPNGIDVKPFGFLNNGQGFKSFWDRITQQKFYLPMTCTKVAVLLGTVGFYLELSLPLKLR